jgi:hypothetical protein
MSVSGSRVNSWVADRVASCTWVQAYRRIMTISPGPEGWVPRHLHPADGATADSGRRVRPVLHRLDPWPAPRGPDTARTAGRPRRGIVGAGAGRAGVELQSADVTSTLDNIVEDLGRRTGFFDTSACPGSRTWAAVQRSRRLSGLCVRLMLRRVSQCENRLDAILAEGVDEDDLGCVLGRVGDPPGLGELVFVGAIGLL